MAKEDEEGKKAVGDNPEKWVLDASLHSDRHLVSHAHRIPEI